MRRSANMLVGKRSRKPPTVQQGVAADLRKAILTRRLAPGQALRQDELASMLGTSRTPIREALWQLEAEGLVTFRPRRGATVASLSREDIEDVFEIRAEVEGLAARLAASRIAPADVRQLERLNADMDRALTSPERFLTVDNEFHTTIVRCSHRPRVQALASSLRASVEHYLRAYAWQPHVLERSSDQHRRIVAALEAADAEGADRLMVAHVLHTSQTLAGLLEGEDALGEPDSGLTATSGYALASLITPPSSVAPRRPDRPPEM